MLQVDNGPEFVIIFSSAKHWMRGRTREAFNGRLRQECLNQHWFLSLEEARSILEDWRVDYNTQRPHSALAHQTPEEFMKGWQEKAAKHQED